jgi:hypothetical protein
MDFTVNISGTKNVEIELGDLDDDASNALDNELSGSDLEDVSIEEVTVDGGTAVQAEVRFTASLLVELEDDDIEQLVRDNASDALSSAGVHDFDIDSIDAN